MPEPGSKAYDKKRQEYRREAEDRGVRDANERAKDALEEEHPEYRPTGPRTERGRGPKGERESGSTRRQERPGPTE